MAANFTLGAFLQFIQDVPTADIGAAVAAGGLNIPMDVKAATDILAALAKDFFSAHSAAAGLIASPTTDSAPKMAAAIADHVAANT